MDDTPKLHLEKFITPPREDYWTMRVGPWENSIIRKAAKRFRGHEGYRSRIIRMILAEWEELIDKEDEDGPTLTGNTE